MAEVVDAGLIVGDILRDAADVKAKIFADRIPQSDPKKPPTDMFPAVRIRLLSGTDEHGLDGSTGVHRQRVQVDVYALTRQEASSQGIKCHDALRDFKGTKTEHCVQHIHPLGDFQYRIETPKDGSPNYRHIHSRSYRVTAQE